MAPRVLMTTWHRQGRTFGPVLRDMYGVEVQYVHAVQRAGAQVLLVPEPDFAQAPTTDPAAALSGFDGLVVIGGEDLAAETSGAAPETIGENASARRDAWEIGLIRTALAADLPVLAVCRGMQLLNAAYGGTLLGEIADLSGEHPRVPDDVAGALGHRHTVQLVEGTRTAEALGTLTLETNSLHHQAIDRLADGLAVTGAAADGIIEAVEATFTTWCVGIQWHPELMPEDPIQQRLVRSFVEACRSGPGTAARRLGPRTGEPPAQPPPAL